jgi:hypothetical protein
MGGMGIRPNSANQCASGLKQRVGRLHTPSHVVQTALLERFGILVSIGHLNRVRAELGVGSHALHQKKTFHSPALQKNRTGKKEQADSSL